MTKVAPGQVAGHGENHRCLGLVNWEASPKFRDNLPLPLGNPHKHNPHAPPVFTLGAHWSPVKAAFPDRGRAGWKAPHQTRVLPAFLSEFQVPATWPADFGALSALFQDGDSDSDCSGDGRPRSRLPSFVLQGKTNFPEMFQTGHLLFYERFSAYQDYILGEPALFAALISQFAGSLSVSGHQTASGRLSARGVPRPPGFPPPGAVSVLAVCDVFAADCKASEVREFTAEFLEKVLEPSGWRAVWHTNVFEVLVEVNLIPSVSRLSPAKSTLLKLLRPKCSFLIKVCELIENGVLPHRVARAHEAPRAFKDPEGGCQGLGQLLSL